MFKEEKLSKNQKVFIVIVMLIATSFYGYIISQSRIIKKQYQTTIQGKDNEVVILTIIKGIPLTTTKHYVILTNGVKVEVTKRVYDNLSVGDDVLVTVYKYGDKDAKKVNN